MRHGLTRLALVALSALGPLLSGQMTLAEPRHGIAMHGTPALPPDFVALPYANPDAPKGGTLVLAESGSFDSLHPFILKGSAPRQVAQLTVETLLGRSLDEPFSLYGLLAESVETDAGRSFVAFTLRESARFSDGSPVTVDDVLWSFETLGLQGLPRYAESWKKIAKAEQTGPRTVRFTFNTADRELPLILGLRPVLQKAQWQGHDFTASTLEPPVGSGPYVVARAEPGRVIEFRRNPDWWGRDLPFNRGLHNLDTIRIEYFKEDGVMFEAFRAGEIGLFVEPSPAKWAVNYEFPAVADGRIVKAEIPHGRPSGINGFAMNTRRAMFADWRVREALTLAFNFEQINATLNGSALPRVQSYYGNSPLGAPLGTPATGRVAELLAPFAASLIPGTVEGYAPPASDPGGMDRRNLRQATRLLQEAGWQARDGILHDAKGEPFAFDILLPNGATQMIAAANIYVEALRPLGIAASVVTVDAALYNQRTKDYDFDMTHYIRALSLSPGNEQLSYWGSQGVTVPGTMNWPGINDPAVDAMIAAQLAAEDPGDFIAATQALDRLLTAGRYVIPIWYADRSLIAHDARLRYPEKTPLYGAFPGFLPEVWWVQE